MMQNLFTLSMTILGAWSLTCCQAGNFAGDGQNAGRKKPPVLQVCDVNKDKDCKTSTSPFPTGTNPTPTGTTGINPVEPNSKPVLGSDGNGACVNRAPMIDFVFAMDVSGSMQNESERVKASFVQLANNLSRISIPGIGQVQKVRFGLLTYEDNILFQAPLNDQLGVVAANIQAQFNAFERGTDPSEAGLPAAQYGIEMAKAGGDSIKVLFLATDAYSHDGGGYDGNRTYNTFALEQSLSGPLMKLGFIFTATDPYGGSGNLLNLPPGLSNAQAQWAQIRARTGIRGKDYNISNFSVGDISNDIPSFIQSGLRKCN